MGFVSGGFFFFVFYILYVCFHFLRVGVGVCFLKFCLCVCSLSGRFRGLGCFFFAENF